MIRSLIKPCLGIVVFATIMALGFNLIMPQGLSFMPPEISDPLWREVTAPQAFEQAKNGAMVVDARLAGDFNARRVRGALKIPVQELADMYKLLHTTLRKAPAIVIYGRTFSTFPAATVAQFLREQGFKKVYVCQASLEDLHKAGFQLQEPRRRADS
jgi:rhodanese-related sulfurtransferase